MTKKALEHKPQAQDHAAVDQLTAMPKVEAEKYLSRVDAIVENYVSYSHDLDTGIIYTAYDVASKAHAHQMRETGEPYIVHPLAVAEILTEINVDKETLIAGFLHDTVEDTVVTKQDIEESFGVQVASLVDGVTKLGKISYYSREEQQAQNFRKMFLAMAQDIRVVLIKLADRLHNMRTLKFKRPARQKAISRETLDIYAPLASRLGIYRIKWELEDLCLRYIDPEGYYELVAGIANKRSDREAFLENVVLAFHRHLEAMNIEGEISARPKHFYSIYQKMHKQHKSLNEIYDLLGCRIIVNNVAECYAVLGMVHEMYPPMPGRFKDYIAMPKSNMYQSLHTTVIGPQAIPFEVQIRTHDMDRIAEYGIAAHWKYKEGGREKNDPVENKLTWLRQLLEWSSDMNEASDYLDSLKESLIEDEIFVFTPQGDVVSLPVGSVPIDFAYHIHSEIGHSLVGARANGHMVPLDYKLQNGDIVEALTSDQTKGPSRDWLGIVKSATAKNKIKNWFKTSQRSENIERGKAALIDKIQKEGFPLKMLEKPYIDASLERYQQKSLDDLYASIGYGGISVNRIYPKLRDDYIRGLTPAERTILGYAVTDKGNVVKSDHDMLLAPQQIGDDTSSFVGKSPGDLHIQVRGMENCLVHLAKCCNPVPGDKIVGFITRGNGVTVHRRDCKNIASIENQVGVSEESAERAARLIEVSWGDAPHKDNFEVMLTVYAKDRNSLLADVSTAISEVQVPILTGRMYFGKEDRGVLQMLVAVKNQNELDEVCQHIRTVEGVYRIKRGS